MHTWLHVQLDQKILDGLYLRGLGCSGGSGGLGDPGGLGGPGEPGGPAAKKPHIKSPEKRMNRTLKMFLGQRLKFPFVSGSCELKKVCFAQKTFGEIW